MKDKKKTEPQIYTVSVQKQAPPGNITVHAPTRPAPGRESNPVFSPDGSQIAFSGEYDGNVDVYVMPAGINGWEKAGKPVEKG